ncbi:MAG: Endonuclease/Exonuclease/phosphatase family protein [Bacteroidetes bacterium]|nr:Endonuclease/Exonuclease/phosphatase family protein [Bacteroidota bacterium]
MKRYILNFILATFCVLTTSCGTQQKVLNADVMTFNIRLNVPSDSLNSWQYRKDNAANMIRYYAPDILGMQEVLYNQLIDLRERLPQYTAIGVGRTDGKEAGEYCSLFFKADRFELIKEGNFGLSETPEKIGIKGWDAAYERIVTWAILKEKKTGKKFVCFNTHLDNMGEIARREGAKLLLAKAKELAPGLPVVITGDFNGTSDSEPIQIITHNGMKDTRNESPIVYGPSWSFHDFGRLKNSERVLIDYIFVSNPVQINKYCVIKDTPEQGYLSDHNPILVNITIK